MKKKITYFYLISFISIFIILFTLDFLYKKYVVNLSLGNHYQVSASQVSNFKENSLNAILESVFQKKEFENNSYKIKKLDIQNLKPSIKSIHSIINFQLILNKNVEDIKLEEEINKTYLNLINGTINELNDNNLKFNYESLRKVYLQQRENNIEKKYNILIKSDFFKKYPPKNCLESKVVCFAVYSDYYNFIYKYLEKDLNNASSQIEGWINQNNNQNQSILDMFLDFNSNKFLFDNSEFLFEPEQNKLENEFMAKKYYELIKSEIFLNHIGSLDNYCKVYVPKCFKKISNEFTTLLYISKLESTKKYKVSSIKQLNKKFNIYNDIVIILGISCVLTYALFIFTYKLLRRKLK